MTPFEREALKALQSIDKSLKALGAPLSVVGSGVDSGPGRTFTEPQRGVQRLTEPSDEQLRAYGEELRRLTESSATPEAEWKEYKAAWRAEGDEFSLTYKDWRAEQKALRLQESTGEVSPRLVEKLLNPEGH